MRESGPTTFMAVRVVIGGKLWIIRGADWIWTDEAGNLPDDETLIELNNWARKNSPGVRAAIAECRLIADRN